MLIYKITNNFNDLVYIGQTIKTMQSRWIGHKCDAKRGGTNHPMYNAMRKHGVENFTITMIAWATNITELNYQERLLIHKNNTLWPNGYNIMDGGCKSGYIKKHNSKIHVKVINIKTGKTWCSISSCAVENDIHPSTLSRKIIGTRGNDTDFRILGKESLKKEWNDNNGLMNAKRVRNKDTGEIFDSAAEAWRCWESSNKKSYKTFTQTLLGNRKTKSTHFEYISEQPL